MKFSLRLILLVLLAFLVACVLSDSNVNKTSANTNTTNTNTSYVGKAEHKSPGNVQLLKNGLNLKGGKQLQRNGQGIKMGNGGKGIASGGLKRAGGQLGGMRRKNNPNGGGRKKKGRGKVGNGGFIDSYDSQSSDYLNTQDIPTGGDFSSTDYVEEDYSLNNNKKGKGRGNRKRGNKRNRGRGKGSGNRNQGGIPDHSLDGFDEMPPPGYGGSKTQDEAPAAAEEEPAEEEE